MNNASQNAARIGDAATARTPAPVRPVAAVAAPAADESAPRRRHRSTLHAQTVASNALVITALIFIDVALLRGGDDSPGLRSELVLVMIAIAASLLVNIVMLSRQFRPLDSLVQTMESIDLSHPDERAVAPPDATADVAELFETFNQMMQRLETERQERAVAAVRAQEAERARVARDLHDEANQALTAVLLRLEAASHNADDDVAAEIREAKALAGQAIEDLLDVSRRLRPSALDLGLRGALKAMVGTVKPEDDVRVDLALDGGTAALDDDTELAIYRVAQESLNNALQHAGAKSVTIRFSGGPPAVLEVTDDGRGFDPEGPTGRYGLIGMRERALLAGGTLKIDSEAGSGTTVRLEIK